MDSIKLGSKSWPKISQANYNTRFYAVVQIFDPELCKKKTEFPFFSSVKVFYRKKVTNTCFCVFPFRC